ncbi:MAG: flavin-dependent oxidoreductase [Phenylobacterium sp.]|nr:MAG: flavin-dependent oxidoreductase [Phenylobacterium sp.]
MRVIVAGGGIGGLTAALALHRLGHDVLVLEAAPAIRPLGVGINLLPHAGEILAALGALPFVEGDAVATRELVYFNRHGQRIWGEPRGRFAGHATPQLSLHRGRLQLGLLDAVRAQLGQASVVTDRRVTRVEQDGSRVVVVAETQAGQVVGFDGDLLIAADGIHSRIRAQFYPDEGPPSYSGRVLWRGLSFGAPFLTGASMIMAGHQNQKFVAYPIGPVWADGRQPINWIAELPVAKMLEREDWNRPGRLEDFLPAFEGWRFEWLDVPGLIRSADAVFEFPMVDRDPLPRWSQGRVTLLGDAAHPMYPVGSNGASQAVLDADALARALGEGAGPEEALAAYEAQRLPATAAIVRANRGNGPERCMQLAEERAPQGFDRIDDVFAPGELEAISRSYQVLTGLQRTQKAH